MLKKNIRLKVDANHSEILSCAIMLSIPPTPLKRWLYLLEMNLKYNTNMQ